MIRGFSYEKQQCLVVTVTNCLAPLVSTSSARWRAVKRLLRKLKRNEADVMKTPRNDSCKKRQLPSLDETKSEQYALPRNSACLLSVGNVRSEQQSALDPAVGTIQHRLPQRYLLALRVHPLHRLLPWFTCNVPHQSRCFSALKLLIVSACKKSSSSDLQAIFSKGLLRGTYMSETWPNLCEKFWPIIIYSRSARNFHLGL